MIEYQDFVRKSFPVQAVQISPLNIEALAKESGGELKRDGQKEGHLSRDYIYIDVKFARNEEQKKAWVGDWIVKQGRTFKIYRGKQFQQTFELKGAVASEPQPRPRPQGKKNRKQPQKPRPQGTPRPSPASIPQQRGNPSTVHSDFAKSLEVTSPEAAAARRSDPPVVPSSVEEVLATPVPMQQAPFVEKPLQDQDFTPVNPGVEGPIPEDRHPITREQVEAEDQAHAEQVVAEQNARIDRLHGPGAAAALDKALADGSIFSDGTPVFADERGPEGYAPGDLVDVIPNEEPVGKPITLDELEAQTGDPRTANEITAGD